MKKFFFWFFTVIQILFFMGIFILERLFHEYMTMMRFVLYKNRIWEAELPIDSLLLGSKIILITLAFLAILLLIIFVIKNKAFHFYGHLQLLALPVIAGSSVVFITVSSIEVMRTYYFTVSLLLIMTALQLIKVSFFIKS